MNCRKALQNFTPICFTKNYMSCFNVEALQCCNLNYFSGLLQVIVAYISEATGNSWCSACRSGRCAERDEEEGIIRFLLKYDLPS